MSYSTSPLPLGIPTVDLTGSAGATTASMESVCVKSLRGGYSGKGERKLMPTSAGADDRNITICPGCGYPTLGTALCAVCALAWADATVDLAINIVDDAPDLNPAA